MLSNLCQSIAVVFVLLGVLASVPEVTSLQNIVLAGGTGPLGKALASRLFQEEKYQVTILARNAFLAAAPSRVTNEFGYLGESFLRKNSPRVKLRDWDGGDLLDIVGQDWLGWQQDTLAQADCVVLLTGGFTEQRVMATERVLREMLAWSKNKNAKIITVSPENVENLSPGARALKEERIQRCEQMIKQNWNNCECLRLPIYQIEKNSEIILRSIETYNQK